MSKKIIHLLAAVLLLLCTTASLAQERAFIKRVDLAERDAVVQANELEIRSAQYFARPGAFGIYTVDLSVLEKPGETFVLDVPGGGQIEVASNGIEYNRTQIESLAHWSGSVANPAPYPDYKVNFSISTWSITPDGEWRYPDPSRERTQAAIENKLGVVSVESVERLDEKQVRIINSASFPFPSGETRLVLRRIEGDKTYRYFMVYVEDTEKRYSLPADNMGHEERANYEPPNERARVQHKKRLEWEKEQLRRHESYKAHVAMTRQQLGLTKVPE